MHFSRPSGVPGRLGHRTGAAAGARRRRGARRRPGPRRRGLWGRRTYGGRHDPPTMPEYLRLLGGVIRAVLRTRSDLVAPTAAWLSRRLWGVPIRARGTKGTGTLTRGCSPLSTPSLTCCWTSLWFVPT